MDGFGRDSSCKVRVCYIPVLPSRDKMRYRLLEKKKTHTHTHSHTHNYYYIIHTGTD